MSEADPRLPIVRYLRRVDTILPGGGRRIALRRGRLDDGSRVWTIEATRAGITEPMNLSDVAMRALVAAFAVLDTETLPPAPEREAGERRAEVL